ncbi:MAG: hypothetical protein EKK45_03010 [Curvibacter sp.]|nr:MAG: hypothetical protein EKK45_03010 [Curvibacter sp.]
MHHYKLVPELEEWDAHNGGEMDPEGWAACMGSYSLACGYASLFWPHFTEAAGVVVRGPTDEAYVLSWLAGDNVNRQQVEATINHLHLLDVQHPGVYETVTDEQLSFLGQTLRATWAAKLAIDFPGRDFVVEYYKGSPDDRNAHVVTFYERRLDASGRASAREMGSDCTP